MAVPTLLSTQVRDENYAGLTYRPFFQRDGLFY